MPIKSLLTTFALLLAFAAPANAASGQGQTLLNAIDTSQALSGQLKLSESQRVTYNQEMNAVEVCIANARKAYKKSKKKASNRAMRQRWEHMLRFTRETSKDGLIYAAMEERIKTWADNLAALNLTDPDLAGINKSGPAFLQASLAANKRVGPGWGCRLTGLLVKSKKPVTDKRGRPTKAGNMIVPQSMGISSKQLDRDYSLLGRLADDNSLIAERLAGYEEESDEVENYQVSEAELDWYNSLLTSSIDLVKYVRTD